MESNASQSTNSVNSQVLNVIEDIIHITDNQMIDEKSNDSIDPQIEFDLIIDQNVFNSFFSTIDPSINETIDRENEVNTNQNETQIKDNCNGNDFNSESIVGINSSEEKNRKIRRIYKEKIKKSNENVTKTLKTNRKLVQKKVLDNKCNDFKKSNDERKSCAKLNAMFGHINDSIDSNQFERLYSLQCENWFKRETRLCETQNIWFL
jgi:hypothetical protein